jgi:hypothetical protein
VPAGGNRAESTQNGQTVEPAATDAPCRCASFRQTTRINHCSPSSRTDDGKKTKKQKNKKTTFA